MKTIVKVGLTAVAIAAAVSCGYLYGKRSGAAASGSALQARAVDYACPMHPFIITNSPSACPICGMQLVKKVAGSGINDQGLQQISHVALSPTQKVLANVQTMAASVQPLSREISCTGIVSFNQEQQGKVAAFAGGRLERLLVKSVGVQVRKGAPVAELFSQDLYNAELQYLMAYKTVKVLNTSLSATFPINSQMSMGDAHDRLRQLGFKDEQFEALNKAGKPVVRIPIYSPYGGVVTEKLVQEGQYVNTGDALFSIADLSPIWIDLELFESDFPLVKVGQEVAISSQSFPGQTFHGRVKLIYPFLDAKTRTVRVRVELPNPGQKLKPDMYVTATIKAPLADSLVLPQAAVLDTGKRQVVWVEGAPGVFLQREVQTGAKSGKNVQILSGVKLGEKVAITGGYLIDSEAQLNHADERPAGRPAPAGSAAPAVKPVAVPAAQKSALDMGDMKMDEPGQAGQGQLLKKKR